MGMDNTTRRLRGLSQLKTQGSILLQTHRNNEKVRAKDAQKEADRREQARNPRRREAGTVENRRKYSSRSPPSTDREVTPGSDDAQMEMSDGEYNQEPNEAVATPSRNGSEEPLEGHRELRELQSMFDTEGPVDDNDAYHEADFEIPVKLRSYRGQRPAPSPSPGKELTLDEVAQFLYRDLTQEGEFGGCSAQDHLSRETEHVNDGHTCAPLASTYPPNSSWGPYLGLSTAGLHSRPTKQGQTMRDRDVKLAVEYMEGLQRPAQTATPPRDPESPESNAGDNASTQPKHICLEQSSTRPDQTSAWVSYDVDSVMFMSDSLAALKSGLNWEMARSTSQMVRTDLHFRVSITYVDDQGQTRRQQKKIHEIPHLFMGRAVSPASAQVFVFFPRLFDNTKRKFTYLKSETEEVWVETWLKACKLPSEYLQHFPADPLNASFLASAKSKEGLGSSSTKRNFAYTIQREHLQNAKDMLGGLIEGDETLHIYRDFFFLVTSKNTKLRTKNTRGLAESMSTWFETWERDMDMTCIDKTKMWVDIGKEICPYGPADGNDMPNPHVYLYRTCDLKKVAATYRQKLFLDGAGQPSQGTVNLYSTGCLRDASDMTILAPKRSSAFRHGLYYSQWYGSVKEVFDAGNIYPFAHKAMLELSLDPQAWNTVMEENKSRKGGSVRKWTGVSDTYHWSKLRVSAALAGALEKSFGVRKEHRVTCGLFDAILAQAKGREDEANEDELADNQAAAAEGQRPRLYLDKAPSYVWSIPSEDWMGYLRGNYHKLTTAFELGYSTAPNKAIGLERTRVLFAILQMLQMFFNAQWSRSSLLNAGHSQNGSIRGMGMGQTMEKYGFGWWLHQVDWNKYEIPLPNRLSFPKIPSLLRETIKTQTGFQRLQSRERLATYFELYKRLRLPKNSQFLQRGQYILVRLMCHVCMSEYRLYIKSKLFAFGELRLDTAQHYDDMRFGLKEWIEWSNPEVSVLDPAQSSKAASDKKKGRDARRQKVEGTLWGFGEDEYEKERAKIKTTDFRDLWLRVIDFLEPYMPAKEELFGIMTYEFWSHHWSVPSVTAEGICSKTRFDKANQCYGTRKLVTIEPYPKLGAGGIICPPALKATGSLNEPSPPWPYAENKYSVETLWKHITSRTTHEHHEALHPGTGPYAAPLEDDPYEDSHSLASVGDSDEEAGASRFNPIEVED